MTPPQRTWRIVHSESSLGWGGQEHRVLAELQGFQDRGSKVWLVAPRESEVYKRAVQAGVTVKAINFKREFFLPNVLILAAWLAAKRIQILNSHSSQDGWVSGVAGRMAFVPFLIRSRHIDVDYPIRGLSRHAFTSIADHIITTSDKISAHFNEYFSIPREKISTIPTGIHLDTFSPEGARASIRPAGLAQDAPLAGMISVLRSWKGHATFLDAAKLLLDSGFAAHFIIAGDGPGREAIPREVENRSLQNHVTMLGHREDVPSLLRALDFLIIPSTKHEGVPQIGLQALAAQTPVIGSDIGGIPEIVRHGVTGRIFPAGNAGALADAIRKGWEEKEATRRMSQAGNMLAQKEHSFDSMLNKLEKLYEKRLIR